MFAILAVGATAMGPVCHGLDVVSDWRVAVQSHFKFVPQIPAVSEPALPPSFPILMLPGTTPDTVQLAPVFVRAKPIFAELRSDFAEQKADAKTAEICRKLGIGFTGVHSGRFGVGFVTVLYVPVMFLGGMTW